MYKNLYKIVPLVFLMLLLTACTQQEINEQQNVSSGTAEGNKDVVQAENNSNTQPDAADISNKDILATSAGTTVTQTIETSAGGVISIDAQVDVDGISRVSRYRYIPLEFTDERRRALLKKMFPAEGWDVNEAAVYNEKEDQWEIVTPRGESCVCQVRDSRILDEQIVNVERLGAALDYAAESEVTSIRLPNTPAEDMMLFLEFTDFKQKLSEIEQIGKMTIASVTEEVVYFCNYIHICGKDGEHPYIKAVFKQTVDGMPVTTWHDIGTAALKESLFPVRVWGSFYSMEEIGLTELILTPAEAVAAMQEQIDSIQMQETQMCIKKISLEYLAVISSEGTPEIVPVWRFWPGNDERERSMMCEQIFAVNAVSGELVWANQGVFKE